MQAWQQFHGGMRKRGQFERAAGKICKKKMRHIDVNPSKTTGTDSCLYVDFGASLWARIRASIIPDGRWGGTNFA